MKPNSHEPLSAISSHWWQIKSTWSLVFWHFCGAVAVGCLILCRKWSWKWKMRIQGSGSATLSLWIVRAAALVSGYLQEPAKYNFLPRTEIASSSSIWDICVFVLIYDQGHKAILGELGKCSKASKSREALALQSGSFRVIAFYLCSLIPFPCHEAIKMKVKTFWKSVKTWIYFLHCMLVSLAFEAFRLK